MCLGVADTKYFQLIEQLYSVINKKLTLSHIYVMFQLTLSKLLYF